MRRRAPLLSACDRVGLVIDCSRRCAMHTFVGSSLSRVGGSAAGTLARVARPRHATWGTAAATTCSQPSATSTHRPGNEKLEGFLFSGNKKLPNFLPLLGPRLPLTRHSGRRWTGLSPAFDHRQ